jgi:uncharacterized membrane protein YeaQ/YmgE (transglycosylase-associated protein family)
MEDRMAGVGIIGTIIIGLLAGWLAERFTKSDHGLLTNLVLGVLGAVVFGWVVRQLGFFPVGWIANLIGGTIGAIVLIVGYRQFKR